MLETIWFVLWGVLWTVYFVLDGFDLGLGTLLPFLAHNDAERRVIFNVQGPFWDGNEVWLLTAGGATFAAFPKTYAVMFSSLYTPLMLLLFALILRGISFEMRSKEQARWWRTTWDTCMVVGSFLPALLLGVAFANIFQGLPLDSEGVLHGNLFTLLNPYGLLGGVLFVLLFTVHGSLWLAVKSAGEMRERGARMAARLWLPLLVVAGGFLVATAFATDLYANVGRWPLLAIFPLLAVLGLVGSRVFLARQAYGKAWGASAATIGGATAFGVAGLYPRLLPSSLDAGATLTAFNSASSTLTLSIMLGVAVVFVPLVLAYQFWVYRTFSYPITPAEVGTSQAGY
ncbi:MAG: cytochrome d ubiquinol oxidase subunit II [Thermoanaerobaculaceae bacterium]|jgi:cytochrome d ubiquinol oxidase subunit II|nr:cytochrome d ubiquinol oxidase subunit II [Thermoanaerobaculaceae bacterium]